MPPIGMQANVLPIYTACLGKSNGKKDQRFAGEIFRISPVFTYSHSISERCLGWLRYLLLDFRFNPPVPPL